jgi:arginine N-succinyltransferase
MFVVRPVRMDDMDRLVELATSASYGLTSLPKDPELLRKRILESLNSFAKPADKPRGELYLFVLEDATTNLIVGTSCIVSKVGGFEPFYAYRVENRVHESESLHIRKELQILNLVAEHSGPSEIGGLFLVPDHRKHGNGRLLSLFRFLFMIERHVRFEPTVIAEMRGVVDQQGNSPFWEGLGRKFFELDYSKADLLSVMDKSFIADLMPSCPIYALLLPESAQQVIGKVHPNTEPALKMLQDEGFVKSDMVDIFEAGPLVYCRLDEIRIVRESKSAWVYEITDKEIESPRYIIANTDTDFRACFGAAEDAIESGIRIGPETAGALNVKVGSRVRYGPAHPAG